MKCCEYLLNYILIHTYRCFRRFFADERETAEGRKIRIATAGVYTGFVITYYRRCGCRVEPVCPAVGAVIQKKVSSLLTFFIV